MTKHRAPLPPLDRNVAALLVRTGEPRWDYGALATLRSLALCGVTVHLLANPNETELLRSRYATSVLAGPLDPEASPAESATRVNQIAARIGGPVFAIAGDDESAVLLAEQRNALAPSLLTFDVPGDLPRRLSSKTSLAAICSANGINYPASLAGTDPDDILAFADSVGFPVVVKAPEPYARLHESDVVRTQILGTHRALADVLAQWPTDRPILVQQYLAGDGFDFWYAAGLAVDSGPRWHGFTGRKEVAYPTRTGVGTYSVAATQASLASAMQQLCRRIGFRGPFDSDWAVDRATGEAWLIDFNPRRGAQFRLFTTTTGLDIVRAAHLAISGRPIDWGQPVIPRSHSVGNLNLLVARQWWAARKAAGKPPNEGAWWCRQDPAPAVAIGASFVGTAARKVGRVVAQRTWAPAATAGTHEDLSYEVDG